MSRVESGAKRKQDRFSIQLFIAFRRLVWNVAAMPKRKVVFSGLLAFGAGVAVGANFPRAGNFLGCLLQRLGFELTDLTLWMWDPERSLADTSGKPMRSKSKKRKALALIQPGNPPKGSGKAKGKDSPRTPSATGMRTRRKSSDQVDQPWIVNSHARHATKNGISHARSKPGAARLSLTKLDDSAVATARRRSKGAVVKRKTRPDGVGAKSSTFRRSVSPAHVALN
jgi:hypothetical protein